MWWALSGYLALDTPTVAMFSIYGSTPMTIKIYGTHNKKWCDLYEGVG